MDIRLDGRVALVTGASSGLGERFARVLAASGARVVLAARRRERLETLAGEIRATGGSAHAVAMDVTVVESIEAGVAEAEAALGPIDVLVNNSGVSEAKRLGDYSEAEYDHVMDTNLKGAFFVAQAVGRRMVARARAAAGGDDPVRGGRIINIASTAGLRPLAQLAVYSMSKAAVVQMTRAMAHEWGRFGINTNAICPGYIETDINREHWDTPSGQKLISILPRRRVGQADDLDALVVMLASDSTQFVNGAVIAADDGLSAG
jgi:NAD(P)-dependent dehydrogenase (short-subunit alcohol dehydrogenase family)